MSRRSLRSVRERRPSLPQLAGGLSHPRCRIDLEWLKMLVTVTLNEVFVLIVSPKPLPVKHVPRCPRCRGDLTCVGFITAGDWPFTTDTS